MTTSKRAYRTCLNHQSHTHPIAFCSCLLTAPSVLPKTLKFAQNIYKDLSILPDYKFGSKTDKTNTENRSIGKSGKRTEMSAMQVDEHQSQ